MQRNAESCAHRAFTLIDLMIVVAIIAILISILLPSLACAREQAYQVKCAAALEGIGLRVMHYAHDHNDYLPSLERGEEYWAAHLVPYLEIRRRKVGSRSGLLQCPADENPPYYHLTGPDAGRVATRTDKILADSGQWRTNISNGARRRDQSAGTPTAAEAGPLIEPVSYAASVDNFYVNRGGNNWHRRNDSKPWAGSRLPEKPE